MAGTVVEVPTDEEFPVFLQAAGSKLVVVDFHAQWCGPCKRIAPAVKDLALKYVSAAVFLKVDVDQLQMTAQAYTVQSMPTFMFFKNGQKVDQFSGANPQKLDETIKKHLVDTSAPAGPIVGHTNIVDFIQTNQIECLNQSETHTVSALFTEDQSYLESDCDEQLILTVPFNQPVKIHSIRVRSVADGSGPKKIRLFINRANAPDFDEADEIPCAQELELGASDLEDNAIIPLKFVRFQNVTSLTIFVSSNQSDMDTTKISYLEFIGSPRAATNMNEFKRVAGKAGESDH
eukprot:CFRG8400T1